MDNFLNENNEINFNINDYYITIIDGICTIKKKYDSIDEINKIDFIKSTIINCKIYNDIEIISDKLNYTPILSDIYDNVDKEYLLSKYNHRISYDFKTFQKKKDFKWNDVHKFSWRTRNANGSLKEIIEICMEKKYNILLEIKLENNKLLNYKI